MRRIVLLLCLCLLTISSVACGSRAATPTPRPVDSAATGAALITQAVEVLLDRYVDQLDSAALYTVAYDATVMGLREAGQTPRGERPTFTGDRQQDTERFQAAYQALTVTAGAGHLQTALAHNAIRSITDWIGECHTNFLDPHQYQQTTARLEGRGQYAGIGVSVRANTRPLVIGEVFSNTPAARSGLRPGDAILTVDGTDVSTLAAEQVTPLVRGQEGTQVTLTIQRPGEPAFHNVTITRAIVQLPVFASRVEAGPDGTKIGYMRLYSFSTGADKEIQRALEEFDRQGVTGWVFDLRDNGGGYVSTLSAIAGRFLKEDTLIASTVQRGGEERTIVVEQDHYFARQRPLAILINDGSASASEAFAAAAQEHGIARLFGQTTSGCLAAAVSVLLTDGSAVGVTIEKVISPNKREINRVGVRPDELIDPHLSGPDDPVLAAAIRWLGTQR